MNKEITIYELLGLIKDNKIIGKWENGKDYCYTLSAPQVVVVNKLNQVINYINRKEDK